MALAQLCSMLQQNPRLFSEHQYLQAFIVDHKAREGSQLEAGMVTARLRSMSRKSSTLLRPAADFGEIYLLRFYPSIGRPMCDL